MWGNWNRNEKLGFLSLIVAVIGTSATVAVVPEVRERFASAATSPRNGILAATILPSGEGAIRMDENQLRQLCETRLRSNDLAGMTANELELLRNGIFALHGRPFARRDLREFFNRQPWYRSDPTYEDGRLTAIDTYNVGLILRAERSAN